MITLICSRILGSPGGVIAVIVVLLTNVTEVALIPPTVTLTGPVKLVPVIVKSVPPV